MLRLLHFTSHRAALDLFLPGRVLVRGVASNQVQHLELGLVKPQEIPMGPVPKVVQAPLDSTPSFRIVNSITQLGATCKFAEDTLDAIVSSMKMVNRAGPSVDPWGTPHIPGHRAVEHYSLDAAIQAIPYPPCSTHQVLFPPIWKEGCCGRPCQKPYRGPDEWPP